MPTYVDQWSDTWSDTWGQSSAPSIGSADTSNATCVKRHTAIIYDRGGMNRFGQGQLLDITNLQWSRVMDGKSQASITIAGTKECAAQADFLSSIQPRRHELRIFRGEEPVWEGPIVQTQSFSTYFTLTANDIIEYLDFTALSVPWPAPPVGPPLMVDRIRQIINYELTMNYTMPTNDGPVLVTRWENLNPPANILSFLDIGAGVTHTTAATTEFQESVGAHLAELGRSIGVNYTTVGRRLVVWDGTLSRIPKTLTEADFSGDLGVINDGSAFYNVSHVANQQQVQGTPEIVGHAANDQSYYGPWESCNLTNGASTGVATGSGSSGIDLGSGSGSGSANSQSALNSQARRDLYGLWPVPLQLQTPSGSTIVLGTQLGINDLVAGTNVPVRASHNIRDVYQMQRLQSMTVTETPANETIVVQLTALGEVFA